MKILSACILLLVTAGPCRTEARILVEHRVRNKAPGYCSWCDIETLGRHQGIKAVNGLAKWYMDQKEYRGANEEDIYQQLRLLKVEYQVAKKDLAFIKRKCDEGHGCVVGIVDWPVRGEIHTVIVTDFGTDKVKFVNSNVPTCDWQVDRAWFEKNWDGWALSLIAKENKK